MMTKLEIVLNKSKEQTIEFLKTNKVVISSGKFSGGLSVKATWKNLDNPDNFKFTVDDYPIGPWWGKCALKSDEYNTKTTLTILILPPLFFICFLGLFLILFGYAVTSFGIHNYGTIAFLPSILFPIFAFGLIILFWLLIGKISGRKIKKAIVASFRRQYENEKHQRI